jgi:hypothetical protein
MSQADIFDELLAINEEIGRRFESPYEWMTPSLMAVGLGLCQPTKAGGYDCSPENSRMFARTGGDGIHYSFVLLPDTPVKEGPVVATYPADPDTNNVIVGEDLSEFLCLGCRCGYEMVPYSNRLPPCPDAHGAMDEREIAFARLRQQILDYLVHRLDLKPWADEPRRLEELRQRYLHCLIVRHDAAS